MRTAQSFTKAGTPAKDFKCFSQLLFFSSRTTYRWQFCNYQILADHWLIDRHVMSKFQVLLQSQYRLRALLSRHEPSDFGYFLTDMVLLHLVFGWDSQKKFRINLDHEPIIWTHPIAHSNFWKIKASESARRGSVSGRCLQRQQLNINRHIN